MITEYKTIFLPRIIGVLVPYYVPYLPTLQEEKLVIRRKYTCCFSGQKLESETPASEKYECDEKRIKKKQKNDEREET